MQTSRNHLPNYKRPLFILAAGTICFILAGYRDHAWTLHYAKHPLQPFTTIMAQSLFEGEWPGGSDVGVLVGIIAFFSWIRLKWQQKSPSKVRNNESHSQTLFTLRYIFLSGILAPFAAVHTFKWSVSRARPRTFLEDVLPYLPSDHDFSWLPGFMGLYGPRGYAWNSFPSGHSATCAVLLVFCYAIPMSPTRKALTFAAVFLFTAVMAIARSMAGMHWISDSVASFFIVWIVIDILGQWLTAKASQSDS